jgi:NAD(P)-dependent dehydrogenase (short-subunit alcohol dehydrogenase family)
MKTALVTGCSSGFGKGIVSGLLADGWSVVATMRSAGRRADLLAEEAKAYGDRLLIRELDVAESAQRRAIAVEFDRLDLLVNNAGLGVMGSLEDLTEEQLRRQFEVNFFGAVFLTRAFLPALRRSKGKVLMISSILGRQSFPMSGAYCASKFALEGLSESLAYELSPHGVQVCLVEPGGFRTSMADNTVWAEKCADPSSAYAVQNANLKKMHEKLMSRPGVAPDAVVRLVVSLARRARVPRRVLVGKDALGMNAFASLLPDRVVSFLYTHLYDTLLTKAPA